MIKISDLKEGNIVNVLEEGVEKPGTVVQITREDNMACIDNGVQEFWYPPEEIVPVPLTEKRLTDWLGFEMEVTDLGHKFKKGPFRILVKDPGNYTNLDVWYREDHRHFKHDIYLHELQNIHMDMTKVPLERVATH
ncbi:MAG TPA: hypothetical protein VFQ58_01540 [Flavisolibacter sp.]|jgi:hypothetical protein|nr:hypothetical protein [Flavisolibacter sp.]